MLRLKMLVFLLSIIFLFDTYDIRTITPFKALARDDVENNNKKLISDNDIDLFYNPIQVKYELDKKEELEKKKQKDNEYKKPESREFILTFYTSLESENSSAGPVTCQNKPLTPGGVANNVIPQNTKIYLEGYGQVVVNDKGSDKYFSTDNRLDVFIKREPDENDRHYEHRVNSYGVQKVQGYIVT